MTDERSSEEQSVDMEVSEAAAIKLPRSTSLERADGLLTRLRPIYEGFIHFNSGDSGNCDRPVVRIGTVLL